MNNFDHVYCNTGILSRRVNYTDNIAPDNVGIDETNTRHALRCTGAPLTRSNSKVLSSVSSLGSLGSFNSLYYTIPYTIIPTSNNNKYKIGGCYYE